MENEPSEGEPRIIEPEDLYRRVFMERNNRPPRGKELDEWPKQYLREVLGRDFGPEDCWVDLNLS
ncbi:hypothetical protein HY387_00380 [Candidatus Daviesbacteria bacterium]|nr:hypothetical protein [Candidatus Daviesbacteria bacterium]